MLISNFLKKRFQSLIFSYHNCIVGFFFYFYYFLPLMYRLNLAPHNFFYLLSLFISRSYFEEHFHTNYNLWQRLIPPTFLQVEISNLTRLWPVVLCDSSSHEHDIIDHSRYHVGHRRDQILQILFSK